MLCFVWSLRVYRAENLPSSDGLVIFSRLRGEYLQYFLHCGRSFEFGRANDRCCGVSVAEESWGLYFALTAAVA